jgi:hypothetical protein
MISGYAQMPLRPIIFTAGWVCILLGYSVSRLFAYFGKDEGGRR